MSQHDDIVVGEIPTYSVTPGWGKEKGGGHTVRLRDLSPEARAVLEAALEWDGYNLNMGEYNIARACRAFAQSVQKVN